MRKLNFKLKNLLLFFGVLIIIGGVIASVHTVTRLLTGSGSGGMVTIRSDGFVEKAEPKVDDLLIDISYEEMRIYVFPNNTMLMIKFPKYLKYLNDGTHTIITIEEGEIKITTVSNNWDHFTIYCKEKNLRFFKEGREKEKPKDKKGY